MAGCRCRIHLSQRYLDEKVRKKKQINITIMETLFVFLNAQLLISLRIGNLQMLLEIGLFFFKKKGNQNCITSGLSQFLFL